MTSCRGACAPVLAVVYLVYNAGLTSRAGRGSLRRGDPAGATPGHAHARRAGGGGPAGAVAAHRIASRVANASRWLARAARRAGSNAMGSASDRRGPSDRPPLPSPRPTRSVSAPGGHQRRARERLDGRGDRLVADRRVVRPAARRSPRRRSWPSTARSRSARCDGAGAALALVDELDLDDYYAVPRHASRSTSSAGPHHRSGGRLQRELPKWRRQTPSATSSDSGVDLRAECAG